MSEATKSPSLSEYIIDKASEEMKQHTDAEAPEDFSIIPHPGTVELDCSDNGEFSYDSFQDAVDMLNDNYVLSAWRPLYSKIPVLGKIIIFFQSLFRKMIKFYIEPITEDQTDLNRNVVIFSNQVMNYIDEQKKKEQLYAEELAEMKNTISQLAEENKQLKEELEELQKHK